MTQALAETTMATSSPVVRTETDTAGLDSIVQDIACLLLGQGAFIDPHLVVVESGGHLALGTTSGAMGDLFIALPEQVLIPVDGLTWNDESSEVELSHGHAELTPVQRDLLDAHIQLWNTTNKLETFRTTHPRAAAIDDEELRAAVLGVRTSFMPGDSVRDMLRTRTFSLRSGESSSSVIMPILELADHDSLGAPYSLTDSSLAANYQFVDDSGLTYVSYGPHRDALDLACLYGFSTTTTTFFVSAPMDLDLDGFGRLTIERGVKRRRRPQWWSDGENLTVDYLALDAHSGLFNDLHRPLRKHLVERGASHSRAMSIALAAADMILYENHQRLARIIDAAERNNHSGARVIAQAAQHQRLVIDVIGEMA